MGCDAVANGPKGALLAGNTAGVAPGLPPIGIVSASIDAGGGLLSGLGGPGPGVTAGGVPGALCSLAARGLGYLGNDFKKEIGVWSTMGIKDRGRHRFMSNVHASETI